MTAPPVFPFRPDPDSKPALSYEFLTDVMESSENKEIRQALRDVALRRYSYAILLENSSAVADFREAWYSPERPLRYAVPLWDESALLTGVAGDALSGSFAGRDFEADAYALIYDESGNYELVTIAELSDSLITLEDDVIGTFPIGTTRVAPVMIGWLTPPSMDGRSAEADHGEIAFIEELRGIAGLDETLTEMVPMVAASIQLFWVHGSQPYTPLYTIGLAIVKDANGARIPNKILEWSFVNAALAPADEFIAPALDTQSCRVEMPGGGGFLTATADGVSATIQFIAGGSP